jgi:hypothetical protein
MESKTYTTMEYGELENLADELNVRNYEFVAEEELSNDIKKSYNVTQDDIDDFDWQEWAEFVEGKERRWRAHLLLTRLVMVGKIPMGDILIEVSW